MNLKQALDIVSTPLGVQGYSDNTLLDKVGKIAPAGGPRLDTVSVLHGFRSVRPVDVLLRLASATRPLYRAELYDVHAHWGLLRYLGLFAEGPHGSMVLSAAGRRIVGNQRRVTSEELGIGFAVLLAEEWINSLQPGSTVRTIDIDAALTSGTISAGGLRMLVKKTGVHRPDYLLVAESGSRPWHFSISLLECKGTKTRGNAYHQLARAVGQLDGVMAGGRHLSGLAVSTVVADGSVTYHLLQHRPDWLDRRSPATAASQSPTRPAAGLEVDLTEVSLEELPEVDLRRGGPVDPREMTATALRGSWAALSDLAGNDAAFGRWAPRAMRVRLSRTDADRPQRATFSSGGIDVVGVSNVISLPGGQLQVVLGVEAGVDDALASGDASAVLAAQEQIFRRELRYLSLERRTSSVMSIADDGSALVLNPL